MHKAQNPGPPLPQRSRRGRPADPEIALKLREASRLELAERGWHGASVDGLAERSGVSRTTIYRRYGTLEGVLLLALDNLHERTPVRDTGSLRGDVAAMMDDIIDVWRDPGNANFLRAVLAAQLQGTEFGSLYRAFSVRRRDAVLQILLRASDRGEVREGVDPTVFYDLTFGAVFTRLLLFGEQLSDEFMTALTSVILDGLAA